MDRRDFLKKSALAGAGFMASQSMLGKVISNEITIGKDNQTVGSALDAAKNTQRFEQRKLGKRKVHRLGHGGYLSCWILWM